MEKNVKAELLVVDDHSLILEGICKIVNKMPEVTVADACLLYTSPSPRDRG